jgi:hypothetical protein
LTFLEEQCIAHARCTCCTIKLNTGPTGQYASHGNVCIFPQEPRVLPTILPPPINSLYDEIAVIFVSSNESTITAESLSKSPLLVCRTCILNALQWLKIHNPLCYDVSINADHLAEYPEHGIIPNFPTQQLFNAQTAIAEGSSYTSYQNRQMQLLLKYKIVTS